MTGRILGLFGFGDSDDDQNGGDDDNGGEEEEEGGGGFGECRGGAVWLGARAVGVFGVFFSCP